MARKMKKPVVAPERRLDWLRRSEEGDSPPQIAKSDGFDVRTVRKHIDQAKQEKEVKEARSLVLRNALERHYADLCAYAVKLVQQGQWRVYEPSAPDEYMLPALRQHLPRSPIWGYLNLRDKLASDITQLKQEASKKIEEVVKLDPRLKSTLTESEAGVIPGIISILEFQLEQWTMGYKGLLLEDNLIQESAEKGFVTLHYGFSQMGKVEISHVQVIREVFKDLENRLKEWGEFKQLGKTNTELRRVENNLKDEIAVITLRRVVPGHCRYCPI